MGFIEAARTSSTVTRRDSISGVEADDENMTSGHACRAVLNPGTLPGFQLFFPMPPRPWADAADYENGLMVGNGPLSLAEPRTDEQIVITKNDAWDGDLNDETFPDRLDQITFRDHGRPDTAYNSFEAGEGERRQHPARPHQGGAGESARLTSRSPACSTSCSTSRTRPSAATRTRCSARPSRRRSTDDQRGRHTAATTSTGVTPEGIPAGPTSATTARYDPEARLRRGVGPRGQRAVRSPCPSSFNQ